MASIEDFLTAFKDGVKAEDTYADVREGSVYDILGGVASVLWARASRTIRDEFADTLTATASDSALTERIERIFGTERVLDTYGTGSVTLTRASSSAGAGTFWEGTRINVNDPLAESFFLEVSDDTDVGDFDTNVTLPVRSTVIGNNPITSVARAKVEDIVWDPSWIVTSVSLSAGTIFEPAHELVARALAEERQKRPGTEDAVIRACKATGAAWVKVFPSNYAGPSSDYGLNMVYVGDASYSSTPALIGQCMLALEGAREIGDSLQIRGMQTVRLSVEVIVYLKEAPTKFSTVPLTTRIQNAIASSIKNDFSYSLDGIRGELFRAVEAIQDVDFVSPTVDGSILDVNNNLPPILTHYELRAQDVIVHLKGPR